MGVKGALKGLAGRMGIGVFRLRGKYAEDGLVTMHSDHFRKDPEFRAAYRRGVRASRGIDSGFEWRVHVALWAAQTALRANGDFVECGVNAGFVSSAIMEKLHWNTTGRRFYLIDTFTGPVPEQYSEQEIRDGRLALARQALEAGAYVTDLERVRANFAEWSNAIVVQGRVPEVLEQIKFGQVAFAHIDMNCALPERAAFEFFWERLSPGAVVLFDDYGYYGHDRQRDGISAAARARGAEVLALPTGQGLVMK